MLLVIFGAGASYDSVPHLRPPQGIDHSNPHRPPLANQLFANRAEFVDAMDEFPECKALVPLLRKDGVVIERELAKYREQAKIFPHRFRQLASIQYYLQQMLTVCCSQWALLHRGITNYATVLDAIECWRYELGQRVCFVTFNYDTMLEDAMSQVLHLRPVDIEDYISRPNYSLIKLHGSVNWGREVETPPSFPNDYVPQVLIQAGANLKLSDRYRLIGSYQKVRADGVVVFPAVSIPIENKDEFSCPASHIKALESFLPSVRKVITIGWRATEKDFISVLKQRLPNTPDLLVVSGSSDGVGETVSNLSAAFPIGRTAAVDGGFTGLILEKLGILDAFLRGS